MRRRSALSLALLACTLLALPAAASGQVQARVKNGQTASFGEFKWTAALVFDGAFAHESQFCGGTVVDATTIVTAAHCVAGMGPGAPTTDPPTPSNPNGVEVVANLHDLEDADTDGAYINVAEIHIIRTNRGVDPDSTEPVPRDDVAVLELATPIPSPTAIPPVDAQTTNPTDDARWEVGDPLEVSGWGRIEDDSYPNVMRHATIDRWDDDACTDAYDPDGPGAAASIFSSADMLCALRIGPPDIVIDSCDGDSGGPLTSFAANQSAASGRELVGIVSWGSPECDDPDAGGVYTRVGAPVINAFIKEFLDGDETDDPQPQLNHVESVPTLTGVRQVGETVTCAAAGDETFTRDPDEYDLRLRVGFELEGWTTVARTNYGADSTPGPIQHRLTDAEEGGLLACELYARETGLLDPGGYAVASFVDPTATVAPAPSTTTTPPPPPPPVVPPTVPPLPPQPQPPVFVPRDEGAPRTMRVTRVCRRRRCSLRITAQDTTTTGALPAGVTALQVRLTSKYRCVRRGRRRTCVRRRTLPAQLTTTPGRFRVTTPRLARGLHTVRVTAVDANGNREPRALTYSFRLRR